MVCMDTPPSSAVIPTFPPPSKPSALPASGLSSQAQHESVRLGLCNDCFFAVSEIDPATGECRCGNCRVYQHTGSKRKRKREQSGPPCQGAVPWRETVPSALGLSLIHISEPTRLLSISYAVFCLKKKK
eukprot:TRINITY_DN7240_c0_g1_i1.p1 TRINITY_DN7240_c0_g1~~TRINITY_DN7240_c0_g1_i1.p1  ORF type:complete len:129 (-),score=20.31 TRINITY_DN7240_c0_g1_i1:69-455(-)